MVYRVDRNNFYDKQKPATIYTPSFVSQFLFDILRSSVGKRAGSILDPCVGAGSLLEPWSAAGYEVLGVDVEAQGFLNTKICNYLTLERADFPEKIALTVMNPPFNIDHKTQDYIKQHYGARPLLPEVWLQKTILLFGKDKPMVMFTPYGFRLNQTLKSRRWRKFAEGGYPEISAIVSLPKDLFNGILFHSEILCFNLPRLKPHYFVA